jgi:predicted ATP-dependent endonuclease of OLD family
VSRVLVSEVSIHNYRSLKEIPSVPMGEMTVLVGKNDAGKSNIIYALDMFFNDRQPKDNDFSRGCSPDDTITIEIAFAIADDTTLNTLRNMRFLSGDSKLIVKKIFKPRVRQPSLILKTRDFLDEDFQNLYSKKEGELNSIGAKYDIEFTRSGRSITNDSKIKQLIEYAIQTGLVVGDVYVTPDEDSWKIIEKMLPRFEIFPSELDLDVQRSEVQSPFQVLVEEAIQESEEARENVRSKVEGRVNEEVAKIEKYLLEQTDAITKLTPKYQFQWKKMTTMDFDTTDCSGAEVPLVNRGMGVRRMLMVAFLRYRAEEARVAPTNRILFGIEEPETSLHPSAQRLLIEALHALASAGDQIVITSHSPVFAAEAEREDLVLVKREEGKSIVVARSDLNPEAIVEELGIEPRDLVACFSACIFVEGKSDEVFLSSITKTLRNSGVVDSDFQEKGIGFVLVGGDNLRFFVEGMHLKKINRRFAVVVDSDKKHAGDALSTKLLSWKSRCESAGGKFHILRRRAIENYLHPSAIKRVTGRDVTVTEFDNVKDLISSNYGIESHLRPIVSQMTPPEILEMGRYLDENQQERNELVELVKVLLNLAG